MGDNVLKAGICSLKSIIIATLRWIYCKAT